MEIVLLVIVLWMACHGNSTASDSDVLWMACHGNSTASDSDVLWMACHGNSTASDSDVLWMACDGNSTAGGGVADEDCDRPVIESTTTDSVMDDL